MERRQNSIISSSCISKISRKISRPDFDPFCPQNFFSNFPPPENPFLLFTRESLETGGEAVNTKRERCCRECFPFFSPPAFFPLSFPPRLLFLRSPAEFNSLVQDKRKKIITRLFFPAFRKIYVPLPRSSCSRVPNFANSERARVGIVSRFIRIRNVAPNNFFLPFSKLPEDDYSSKRNIALHSFSEARSSVTSDSKE